MRTDKAKAVVAEIVDAVAAASPFPLTAPSLGAVAAAVERTAAELGRLDILVNNAGIYLPSPVRGHNARRGRTHVGDQCAGRHRRHPGGVAAHGGRRPHHQYRQLPGRPGAGPRRHALRHEKSALVGLTKGLARDLGPRAITVNVVEPGPIDTDMNPATGQGAEDQRATALGRYGTPDDIAAMVAHLASHAGRYITGAAILVDGGFAA